MALTILGHMVISDGQVKVINGKPKYPVVEWLTKQQFDRACQSILNKLAVKEMVDGVIIYYIKSSKS